MCRIVAAHEKQLTLKSQDNSMEALIGYDAIALGALIRNREIS